MKIFKNNLAQTSAAAFLLACAGLIFGAAASAQSGREATNGHGTIIVQDEQGKNVKRQFSFEAHRNNDGTVKGHAILHNASFNGANGKSYQASFDISCMKVYGNVAVLGGFIRRTNDPSLVDAAYFTVQDNGEPGKNNDRISGVYFFDDNPNTTGSPALCESTSPTAFPLDPIDSGNIQVRGQ
jgi:hypothetical protein